MQGNGYLQHRATADRSSDLRMSRYERELARKGMEEAMVLADLTLRTWARVRTLLSGIGKVLR